MQSIQYPELTTCEHLSDLFWVGVEGGSAWLLWGIRSAVGPKRLARLGVVTGSGMD